MRREEVRAGILANDERKTIGRLRPFTCPSCDTLVGPDYTDGPVVIKGELVWVCRECSRGQFPEDAK